MPAFKSGGYALAPAPEDLRSVLEAQIDIQVHLTRDALVGRDAERPHIFQRLHAERRRVLQEQSRILWQRMGARGRADPRALRLWVELAVPLPDAVLVGLCFEAERSEGDPLSDPQSLHRSVGTAYLRLLQRADSFLPARHRWEKDLLPLAVAVTAVRMARKRGHTTSWLYVEPAVHQVVSVLRL